MSIVEVLGLILLIAMVYGVFGVWLISTAYDDKEEE